MCVCADMTELRAGLRSGVEIVSVSGIAAFIAVSGGRAACKGACAVAAMPQHAPSEARVSVSRRARARAKEDAIELKASLARSQIPIAHPAHARESAGFSTPLDGLLRSVNQEVST